MGSRLEIVSRERIRDELDKLIVLPNPTPGLWFLVDTGLAAEFLPELPALALEQDPIQRHKDVLAHTIAVVEKTSPDKVLRLAALFHDIGKPRTRSIGPGGVHFHHHDVVGARMTVASACRSCATRPTRSTTSPPGRAPPAVPHLQDGLDRLRRAPLRPRRRPAAGPAERADAL